MRAAYVDAPKRSADQLEQATDEHIPAPDRIAKQAPYETVFGVRGLVTATTTNTA